MFRFQHFIAIVVAFTVSALAYGQTERPTSLHIFLPHTEPKGVVIALHGCGGLLSSAKSRASELSARHASVAKLITDAGWVALFPDSFSPRGRREICTQKFSERTINSSHRRLDALQTAKWVREQNWSSQDQLRPLKTVILGWSHGGSAVLQSIERTQRGEPARGLIDQGVAFYPGCSEQLKRGYKTDIPLTMFLAGKDDWTAPEPCIELGKNVGATVWVYDEAYHGFDSPVGKVQFRPEIPNGVSPGRGVHSGPNPGAREDAYSKLRSLLRELETP
jgi:dienelactone hydrolase